MNGSETLPRRSIGTPLAGVLHIINGDLYAGAERVQELLAQRLPEFGYRMCFACLKEGQFQQELEGGSHETHLFPMESRTDLVRTARRVAALARDSECGLLHSHGVRSALIGSLASILSGLPLLHHVHSPTVSDTERRWRNTLNAGVEDVALRRASVLVPVSRSLEVYLRRRGFPQERIRHIPNGVALAPKKPDLEPRPELTLGTLALFRPRKGIEVLLHALAALNQIPVRVRLLAVGAFENREYEQAVRRLCSRLGLQEQVQWHGFRRDVRRELEQMDVLVLPSLYGEGMPMVLLEAMAVGLPVIASRVEGVAEAVRDGVDGLLVEPGDVQGIARGIERFAGDRGLLLTMGEAGRERQRRVFSDTVMAARLAQIYDEILCVQYPRTAGGDSWRL